MEDIWRPEHLIRERGEEISRWLGVATVTTYGTALFDDVWYDLVDGEWVPRLLDM